jgi:hypothetical protein
MKTYVRKYVAEQGIAEEEALKKRIGRKIEMVCGKGHGGSREGIIRRLEY